MGPARCSRAPGGVIRINPEKLPVESKMFASECCSKIGCLLGSCTADCCAGRRARLDAFDPHLRVLLSRAIGGPSITHLALQPN